MHLGIIGCGKMGTALVAGAIRAGVVNCADVIGCDPSPASREAFSQATGALATPTPASLAATCDVILLCTKPHDVLTAMREIAAATATASQPRLILSIAAGIPLTTLEAAAPAHFRLIRAMPNTPALVGKGAAAYCLGTRATPADAATAQALLGSVGLALELPERLMNAVTGLSGSGPAYGYVVIEALADGGVQAGLPRAEALRLAAQTLLGAATMVLDSNQHPAVLKDQVTSPGGTTIAGLAELERLGLRAALIAAVGAATRRADELGGRAG
jgi:pyrroline-5-carboxylate reductase